MNPETTTTEAIDDLATSVDRRQRSLYRDTNEKMIAGVCSGLGHYFDIHTTLVRVAFVVFTLLGGAGILAYLVLWFAVDQGPARQTDLERSRQKKARPFTREVT
jgi:phage shock protein PspC (stress-responsive transcriptional regulator)